MSDNSPNPFSDLGKAMIGGNLAIVVSIVMTLILVYASNQFPDTSIAYAILRGIAVPVASAICAFCILYATRGNVQKATRAAIAFFAIFAIVYGPASYSDFLGKRQDAATWQRTEQIIRGIPAPDLSSPFPHF